MTGNDECLSDSVRQGKSLERCARVEVFGVIVIQMFAAMACPVGAVGPVRE